MTDPNNAVAETRYDALGRATESWQPGTATANVRTVYPTVNGNGEIPAPYTIQLQIWDDGGPGGSQYRNAWAFYDGLGRILRTVGPAETSGRYVQSDTWYNALGMVGRSSRPYEVTLAAAPGTYSAPNWSALYATTVTFDGSDAPHRSPPPTARPSARSTMAASPPSSTPTATSVPVRSMTLAASSPSASIPALAAQTCSPHPLTFHFFMLH